jgi:hypothetical protein
LTVAGRVDVDANDRWRVAAAYAELPTQPAASPPIATIIASSLAALAIVAMAWFVVALRTPHRPGRPPAPLVAGAFFHGGTPARDAELETFLADELTTLVIETEAERRGSRDGAPRAKHSAELRSARVITSRGPALATAWRELLDSFDRWANLPLGSKRVREAAADLGMRSKRVSDQLAALGLGYYVHADVILRRVALAMIFVYRVDEVAFVRAGGQPRRVLGLRQIDHLNMRLGMLGRQDDELGDPVVLLDQIDHFVADRVMPTFYGRPYQLGDVMQPRVGDAIRRELVAAIASPGSAGARSNANELRSSIASPGSAGARSNANELRSSIASPGSAGARSNANALRSSIADREPTAAITKLVAASVRRHEARHGIDIDRETPLRMPKALATMLATSTHDPSKPFVLRARAELAAYVSQIGNDPATPHLALWNLASQIYNRDRWGSAESFVAVIVLEGLARQLNFPVEQSAIAGLGAPHLYRLAPTVDRLAAQTDDNLRMAARKLWIELYGEPMLPIVDLLR